MRRALRHPTAFLAIVASLALPVALSLSACNSDSPSPPSPEPTSPATRATATATATPAPSATTTPDPSTATPTPAPTPTPEVDPLPVPQAPMSALQATLDALLAGNVAGGEYAFAVTDLQTGETVGIGLDRPHYAGCVANFFVILQSTIDAQDGRTEESLVGDLISRTIYSSNPVTAYALYGIAGDGEVIEGVQRTADLVEQLGLGDTVLDHPPLYRHVSLGIDSNNWTTAADTNRALAALYAGDVVTEEWRDYLLAKMVEVKVGLNYLTAYGPDEPDALVSHKNGFFPAIDGWYVDNDIGIVRFQRDGEQLAYAISFFSQRVPHKYDDIPFAQRLTVATWQFFQQRYPSTERATAPASN